MAESFGDLVRGADEHGPELVVAVGGEPDGRSGDGDARDDAAIRAPDGGADCGEAELDLLLTTARLSLRT